MTYLLSFNLFCQLQHEISLDLSSQVPIFKVALKFKSRDFGRVSVEKNKGLEMFRVHPRLWHPCEPNEKNETALSAHGFHTSNSAVRTAINWSDIGKGHFECQLWIPGKTPLDLAREEDETEMVSLLMGKASWLHARGSMQWPNGIAGGNISMDETWWNCWHCWEWKHERGLDSACESVPGMFTVRCWTHDPWRSMKPKPTAKSSQATGQKLSTGEPQIWLNLQNWLGENTSDYQIMRGQNRYIFLALDYLQHYIKVTNGHAQSRHLFAKMFLLSYRFFWVK